MRAGDEVGLGGNSGQKEEVDCQIRGRSRMLCSKLLVQSSGFSV